MPSTPPNLDAFWMPFTPNRQFKAEPRLLVSAKGMYYRSDDGRQILDGTAGLWCVAAGHAHPRLVAAVQQQIAELDFAGCFNMAHPKAFEAAERLGGFAPKALNRVFFTNSGSEAVDTALKIALAYQQITGKPNRTRLIGRERAYHGVNFGGVSVGGIPVNRKHYGALLPGVDHLRHPLDIKRNAFSRGVPEHGVELATELETRLLALHDPATVAAVIVEPIQGSTGVILPPKGYLQELRRICDKYGILLIFDEVITGFGRLGANFAADLFGITPDIITCAKALSNGVVPMGAVLVKQKIYDAFVNAAPDGQIDFFHGYTYSAHPLACAAAIAMQDIFKDEGLVPRAASLAKHWEDAAHSLRGLPHVKDIRNLGLIAGIELEPIPGKPTVRAYEVFRRCFWKENLLIRTTGDTIALSPPLIIEKHEIDQLFASLANALKATESIGQVA
jgi:beta-alanine--pyruvate transaminase